MIIGIDASNIRSGGGVTHLREFLYHVKSLEIKFNKIIVWSSNKTLQLLPDLVGFEKKTDPLLNKSLPFVLYWQRFMSAGEMEREKCNILFVPGGSYAGKFKPFITMSRNMLPIELKEAFRFKSPLQRLRFISLRYFQLKTFKKAAGLVFLTTYAKKLTLPLLGNSKPEVRIIPHGINGLFFSLPRKQKDISEYSFKHPYKLLYVSPITVYKHQWNVATAVFNLRKEGIPVELHLIGSYYKPAFKLLKETIEKFDPNNEFIIYHGQINHPELAEYYKKANAFVYASSCENMPNILLEAMAAGLPIACSSYGPMKEVFIEDGIYFDPLNVEDIKNQLRVLIKNKELREKSAGDGYNKAQCFSWTKTAEETFSFFEKTANSYNK